MISHPHRTLFENIERDQSNRTRIQVQNRNKLQAKFDQMDTKLARNQRFLIWQQNKCLRQIDKLYKGASNECPSYLNNYRKSKSKLPSLVFNNIKIKKSIQLDPQVPQNKFSIIPPRSPINNDKQQQHIQSHTAMINDKVASILLKINKVEPDNQSVEEKYHEPYHKQFYNSKQYEKYINMKEEDVNCSLITHKDQSFISKKIIKENRIKYTTDLNDDTTRLNNSVALFQKILRGRAYQTMIIMAKIRYQSILHSSERPVTLGIEQKPQPEITSGDVLKYYKYNHISRFFDTLSKESIHIKYSENKNKLLIEQGNLDRMANEMIERKIRQIEITGRMEQDEILKQVLNIHENISVLFCEKIMEAVTKQSAKEESFTATMKFCKKKFYNFQSNKNIEKELVSNFIIPEAHKVILRESQLLNYT